MRLRRPHLVILLSALLAVVAAAAPIAAQIPRMRDVSGVAPGTLRDHLRSAKFTRTVTVDTSVGDFRTTAAAYAYIGTQTHDSSHTWLVLVSPGIAETGSKPTYTWVTWRQNVPSTAAPCADGQGVTFVAATKSWNCSSGAPSTRLVYVDAAATPLAGSVYTSLAAALSYVAGQTHDSSHMWTVIARTLEGPTPDDDDIPAFTTVHYVNGFRTGSGLGPIIRGNNFTITDDSGDNGLHVSPDSAGIESAGSGVYAQGDDVAISANARAYFAASALNLLASAVPATASDPCTEGDVSFDANYIYRCVATDTWKRAAISTW